LSTPRLAVLYEHPDWFRPLFAELERRRIGYVPLYAGELSYDPAVRKFPYPVVLNRMSPSSYLRGHGQGIFFCREFLRYLRDQGVAVINGYDAYLVETSKCAQLEIFERLGVRYPRARVINHASQALDAADGLNFPVIVKPNIGGSGAKIQHFARREDLAGSVQAGTVDLGIDHTALVQEYLPARDGAIVRVEVLGNEVLYAIRVFPPQGGGFNLCPADICQDEAAAAKPVLQYCPGGEPEKRRMKIERYKPPMEVQQQVLAIARAAEFDMGGIEYLINDGDGEAYFYDANALSNFVTDADRLLGFNPYARLVDLVEERLVGSVSIQGRRASGRLRTLLL
jgi:ribosomal protein S6-L-glutamate ligase RimK-like protein